MKAYHSQDFQSSVAHLQKATKIAPEFVQAYHNLGLALFLLHRFPEAEAATRHALDLAPERSNARYMLGRILAVEGNKPTEAVEILGQAVEEFPDARLPLAVVLLQQGAADQAAAELQTRSGQETGRGVLARKNHEATGHGSLHADCEEAINWTRQSQKKA
jgi:tetratricopeptide (TPR) repeat protein